MFKNYFHSYPFWGTIHDNIFANFYEQLTATIHGNIFAFPGLKKIKNKSININFFKTYSRKYFYEQFIAMNFLEKFKFFLQ